MIVQERHFTPPEPKKGDLWRYVSFDKFVSMLVTRRLYFPRTDMMGDPLEGAVPKPTYEGTLRQFRSIPVELAGPGDHKIAAVKTLNHLYELVRKSCFLSCWHQKRYENMAMWEIYSGKGVAIRSSIDRLTQSLAGDSNDIRLAEVRYINFKTDNIPVDSIYSIIGCKGRAYEFESEVRAVITRFPSKDGRIDLTAEGHVKGIPAEVDLSALIDRVYVSPHAGNWLPETVVAVMDKFGVKGKHVIRSAQAGLPRWYETS